MNIHHIEVSNSVFWAVAHNKLDFIFVNMAEFDKNEEFKEKDIIILNNKDRTKINDVCWTAQKLRSFGKYDYLPGGLIILHFEKMTDEDYSEKGDTDDPGKFE